MASRSRELHHFIIPLAYAIPASSPLKHARNLARALFSRENPDKQGPVEGMFEGVATSPGKVARVFPNGLIYAVWMLTKNDKDHTYR